MASNIPDLPVVMTHELKKNLVHLSAEINQLLDTIDTKNVNVLHKFDEIHHLFHKSQISTASYYLKSCLAPFTEYISDLSIAINHLSERNHGALIAIQRNDLLDNFIHSGIPLHANLSFQLLESIFYPGSALHDGAVLICKNKITSAGNVLPLSDKPEKKKLGTRHRAALGLSEKTDALVLVVSEETGRTTFALDGNLYPIRMSGTIK